MLSYSTYFPHNMRYFTKFVTICIFPLLCNFKLIYSDEQKQWWEILIIESPWDFSSNSLKIYMNQYFLQNSKLQISYNQSKRHKVTSTFNWDFSLRNSWFINTCFPGSTILFQPSPSEYFNQVFQPSASSNTSLSETEHMFHFAACSTFLVIVIRSVDLFPPKLAKMFSI